VRYIAEPLGILSGRRLAPLDDPGRSIGPAEAAQGVAEAATLGAHISTLGPGTPRALGAAQTLSAAEHAKALAVAVDAGVDDRSPGEGVAVLGPVAGHVLDRVEDQGVCLLFVDVKVWENDMDTGLDKRALLDDDGRGLIAD